MAVLHVPGFALLMTRPTIRHQSWPARFGDVEFMGIALALLAVVHLGHAAGLLRSGAPATGAASPAVQVLAPLLAGSVAALLLVRSRWSRIAFVAWALFISARLLEERLPAIGAAGPWMVSLLREGELAGFLVVGLTRGVELLFYLSVPCGLAALALYVHRSVPPLRRPEQRPLP